MSVLECIFGVVVVIAAMVAITFMIFISCKLVINDARKEANRNIEARARLLADKMYRERLANTIIRVNQRVVVIEDDLGGEEHAEV